MAALPTTTLELPEQKLVFLLTTDTLAPVNDHPLPPKQTLQPPTIVA